MTKVEAEQLLDDGFMLLEKFTSLTSVRNKANTGMETLGRPIIRAKYGSRRRWYVLEKGFKDAAARDKRLTELLALPKRRQC